ncbi:hypothetical protein ILYODFUR_017425 [Ilyodon furcidens]|uniref:Uncharacterized protein n=1 Tax=Ilyodon furcidens TaxID=33524 RepID=A0ABV0TJE8_9TELE
MESVLHGTQTRHRNMQDIAVTVEDSIRYVLFRQRRKRTGTLFRGPKSSFKTKANFVVSSRLHCLEEQWRDTESKLLEAQCEISTVKYDLACRLLCLSTGFCQVQSQHCQKYQL